MTEIKLPPLPEPDMYADTCPPMKVFTHNCVSEYGRTCYQAALASQEAQELATPTKTQIDDAMCKVSMPFFPDTTRDETDWIIQQFVKELWKTVASQPPAKNIPKPSPIRDSMSSNHRSYAEGWNACRAAMLAAAPQQEGEPVCGAPIIDKEVCGAQNEIHTPQNKWKAAIDHELVTIGSTADSFETPAEAVAALIDWHIKVATDPAVNGGYKLVPIEPTREMKTAGIGVEVYQESPPDMEALTREEVAAIYQAMLNEAPKPEEAP